VKNENIYFFLSSERGSSKNTASHAVHIQQYQQTAHITLESKLITNYIGLYILVTDIMTNLMNNAHVRCRARPVPL
jgi:hypothetical protein